MKQYTRQMTWRINASDSWRNEAMHQTDDVTNSSDSWRNEAMHQTDDVIFKTSYVMLSLTPVLNAFKSETL